MYIQVPLYSKTAAGNGNQGCSQCLRNAVAGRPGTFRSEEVGFLVSLGVAARMPHGFLAALALSLGQDRDH